jgi:hypothetical protein
MCECLLHIDAVRPFDDQCHVSDTKGKYTRTFFESQRPYIQESGFHIQDMFIFITIYLFICMDNLLTPSQPYLLKSLRPSLSLSAHLSIRKSRNVEQVFVNFAVGNFLSHV